VNGVRLPRSPWWRAAMLVPPFVLAGLLLWWRGPDWPLVFHAFDFVEWRWVAAAFALNLWSVLFRAIAWRTTINQAIDEPHPRFPNVLTSFGIGLFANAVLPGRIGELARVAVLRRHLPHGRGTSATLVGTVVAHRLFDVVPVLLLIAYVLSTAKIPHWAVTSVVIAATVGVALFAFALASARRHHGPVLDEMSTVRRLVAMVRRGLSVMKEPLAAAAAIFFQCLGWLMQLLAVWAAMRAFDIDAPLPAAGLVLLLMNVATIFPLWPGNVGLVQAAVALPLVSYGVAYPTGFAYGIVLQAIEMGVGVVAGLLSFAPEGLSYASLRGMPDASDELPDDEADTLEEDEEPEREPARARAGVSG
jgi:glycosyltransferase 2 family protein